MPSLQIRKLPENIYQALKSEAERERRSLSQQAIISLAKGLDMNVDFRERRRKILKEIQNEMNLWKQWTHVDVTSWIRQDRDNR